MTAGQLAALSRVATKAYGGAEGASLPAGQGSAAPAGTITVPPGMSLNQILRAHWVSASS